MALVALVLRLTVVQVVDGSRYAAYASGEIQQTVTLPASRGAIYDRSGNLLALSVPTVDVVADDFQIAHPASEADAIASVLNQPAGKLTALLAEHNGYVVLAKNASQSLENRLQALDPAGISYLPASERTSPAEALFEPVLGGVNAEQVGDGGLEEKENALLTGTSGSEVLGEGPGGVALPGSATHVVAPRQGTSLVLTIDEPLQLEVTKDLEAEMTAQHADSGVAVVESVRTGAILAMVDLVTGPKGVIEPAEQNLAATSIYQPGSVMKIATFSYALKDGLITPDTSLLVPDYKQIGGYTFADAELHPTVDMTASQILAQSSNIGTIEIANNLLGMTRLGEAFKGLGFGQPTGLNWPGESDGIVGSSASWVGSDRGSVPIGTGVAVTPLQILDAFNAVANGGVMVTPHLVEDTVAGASGKEQAVPVSSHRVLPASVANELVPMLGGVVQAQDGTAVCASVPGYAVAGKTGTAQQPESNGLGYVPGDWNATFVGFVPEQSPQLSGIVWLNHPNTIYGGSVSAPVFSKIMQYALRHYAIAPTGTATVNPAACTAISGQ